ncbi:hypothetical protein NIES2101_35030 [Calothrix sp. HK-06]|nr:hypothetical protein NIES2101_35030 [Calothrix sp. HK-06]
MCKKILIISPTPSHPQDAGNRARIYNLVLNLQKLGHDVHFLYIPHDTSDDHLMRQAWGSKLYFLPLIKLEHRKRSLVKRIIRKLMCSLSRYPTYPEAIDDWYDDSINKFLVKLQKQVKFDVVIVEYVFFSKALKYFAKGVLKIIDTHDIFANRQEMYQKNGLEYFWYSTTAKHEAKGLRRADLIIAIQQEEEEYFKSIVEKRVITVGHTVSLRRPEKKLTKPNLNILYIASNNENNIHGISYFISEVLPKLRAKLPDVQLLIGGKISEVIKYVDGCINLGYIDNLDEVYNTADIVINPILFGTGLKVKSIEALGQSKVLVTTLEGAKGLEAGANKAFLIAKDADEFTHYLIEVFTNPTLFSNLSKNAYAFAKIYNQEVFKPLENILKD